MTPQPKARRSRITLRGPRLEAAAFRDLADLSSWCEGPPLTWVELARRLGVSRQALEAKPAVKEAFHKAKKELTGLRKDNSSGQQLKTALRQEKQNLKAKIEEMQTKLDRWIERWVMVERECQKRQVNPDPILGTGIPDR